MDWNESTIATVLNSAQETPDGLLGTVPYRWVVFRMLKSLWDRQTKDEKQVQHTKNVNGVGFNGPDSQILSDIAQKSLKYQNLTPKQTVLVAKRLVKYRKQLAEIAALNCQTKLALVGNGSGPGTLEKPHQASQNVAKQEVFGVSKPKCPHGQVKDDCDLCWGNEYGKYEAQQEAKAYTAKMDLM